jgi:lipoyl-dependent peroxiredoxin
MFKRSGSSVWSGPGVAGSGKVSVESGMFRDQPYSFNKRFGDEQGTNPEELIAAAHAGCFNMAFSIQLVNAGMEPEELRTTSTLTLDKSSGDWTITAIHLDVHGKVPGADPQKFQEVAEAAKKGCPVSRLLNANITMTAALD